MLTDQHPITPPPELVQQWATEYWGNPGESIGEGEKYIATQAARWGADQELDACCEWVRSSVFIDLDGHDALRAARRPKPPSLAEEALAALEEVDEWAVENMRQFAIHDDLVAGMAAIRYALERLQELESNG